MSHTMKKFISLALSGALLCGVLAGCKGDDGKPSGKPADANDVTFETTGVARDTEVMKVNGKPVTAEIYAFWLGQCIANQQSQGNLTQDAHWEINIQDKPAREFLREDAIEMTKYYAVVSQKAEAEGLGLTEEQAKNIDAQFEDLAKRLEHDGLTVEKMMRAQGISEEGFREILKMEGMGQNLFAKLSEEGGPMAPTDEKMDEFLAEEGFYKVKHILLSTREDVDGVPTPVSAERQAEIKAEADALVAELRAAPDREAFFDQKMAERSDDGRDKDGNLTSPNGYKAVPGQMVEPFEKAAMATEIGEISDPVLSDFGYHIILRLDADDEETRSYYPAYALSKLSEDWIAEAKIEIDQKIIDSIDPKTMADKQLGIMANIQNEAEANRPKPTPAPVPPADDMIAPEGAPAPEATSAPEATPAP